MDFDRVVTVEASRTLNSGWRPASAREVWMLSPEAAAAFANQSPRASYRLVEAGKLHYVEEDDGSLRICQHSLASRAE